mmetsp:Transcript_36014/g.85250  ORF Transcript_36014/g.85250 Transcript_36014/m.85250 type:complete len:244 (-) Transcript_36014:516-1247(-)
MRRPRATECSEAVAWYTATHSPRTVYPSGSDGRQSSSASWSASTDGCGLLMLRPRLSTLRIGSSSPHTSEKERMCADCARSDAILSRASARGVGRSSPNWQESDAWSTSASASPFRLSRSSESGGGEMSEEGVLSQVSSSARRCTHSVMHPQGRSEHDAAMWASGREYRQAPSGRPSSGAEPRAIAAATRWVHASPSMTRKCVSRTESVTASRGWQCRARMYCNTPNGDRILSAVSRLAWASR